MRTKRPVLGLIFAVSSVVLFGLNASTTKVVIQAGISPEQIVIFRSLATALLAGIVLLLTNRAAFRVRRDEWPRLIAFGIVGVALMQWAYSNAVSNLPVGIALLIEYTAIVMVPIASMFLFREKVRPRLWLGIVLVLGGLAVVSKIWDGGLNPVGVAFAFAAAIFLTAYFIMGEHTQRSRDTMSTLFYTMAIATVFWLVASPWWTLEPSLLVEQVSLSGNLSQTYLAVWQLLVWVGIFGSFFPMLFSYLALGNLSATAVGIASAAETVFAFAFGWLWLNEKIEGLQALGGLLVITGIVIAQTARVAKASVSSQ